MNKSMCDIPVQYFPSASEYEDLYSTFIANCVFNSFLSYTTVALNVAVIPAIRKTSSMPKPLKILLVSLAVSDVGVGLLAQPFYTSLLAKWLRQEPPKCATFKSFLILAPLFPQASFLGVVAVSVDRFLAIHLHLRYQELVTKTWVVFVVIFVWVFSVFCSLMPLFFPPNIFLLIFTVVGVVCLLLTLIIYIRIYLVVRRHKNHIQALRTQEVTQDSGEVTHFARVKKSAAGTFYIYLAFLLCYLPVWICLTLFAVYGPVFTLKRFLLYSWTLTSLNSSLNPFIYCWKMKYIRHSLMEILGNMSCYSN